MFLLRCVVYWNPAGCVTVEPQKESTASGEMDGKIVGIAEWNDIEDSISCQYWNSSERILGN